MLLSTTGLPSNASELLKPRRKELGDTYELIDVGDVATIEQLLELDAIMKWAHNMTVLVTGGAGYIGSHMVHALLDAETRSWCSTI
jgi:FlaA1/EpsC-like NDP-sugar epimerase